MKPTDQDREAAQIAIGQWLRTLSATTRIATIDMNRLEATVHSPEHVSCKTDLDMNRVFGDDIDYVVRRERTTRDSAGTRNRDDAGGTRLRAGPFGPDREA